MVETTLDTLAIQVTHVEEDVAEIKGDIKDVKQDYLTVKQFEAEFNPVRNLIYALVLLVLSLVITAIVYLVLNKGG